MRKQQREKLLRAYEAVFRAELRNQIDRAECIARIIALRDSPLAAGLSFEERDALADEAAASVTKSQDEVHFSASGRWQ
jgi:hypothetical protein